jgi:hypothetical protein
MPDPAQDRMAAVQAAGLRDLLAARADANRRFAAAHGALWPELGVPPTPAPKNAPPVAASGDEPTSETSAHQQPRPVGLEPLAEGAELAPTYGTEDYAGVKAADALVGWKYCHDGEQWYRPAEGGDMPARSSDAAKICAAVAEEIAQDAEAIAQGMRRPVVVVDVLWLASIDRRIAAAGYRP